jgi:DNA uptake protein ComE-like DNA-binding protein
MNPAFHERGLTHNQPMVFRASLGAAAALLVVHAAYELAEWRAPHGGAVFATQVQLRIDPNRATAAELDLLPRIGPKIGAAIIAYREAATQQPAFRNPEDLDRVKRIGPATVEALRPYLCFPDSRERVDGESDTP